MIAMWVVIAIIIVQRLSELVISKRHYRWAMEHGGIETGQAHYWMFFVLHIGWLVGVAVEASLRGGALASWAAFPFAGFIAGQGLRYWTISTLGRQWNTRIVAIPGMPLVDRGPFRFVRHPNYVAVVMELACVPLMFEAYVTAIVVTILNAFVLLFVRIPEEMRALSQSGKPHQDS